MKLCSLDFRSFDFSIFIVVRSFASNELLALGMN